MHIKKLVLYSSFLATLIVGAKLYEENKYYNQFIEEVDNHVASNDHDNTVVAHRGFSSLYVENSVEAIINAFDSDCIDEVEIDIRLSKDNKIVLMHNKYINLNCNGKGKVNNKTLEQLKKYEYKQSSFITSETSSPDKKLINKRNKENQKNISEILTLEEVLKMLNNDKTLILDVKTDKDEINFSRELEDILSKYKGKLNIKIQSTDKLFLEIMKKKMPKYSYQMVIKNEKDLSYINSEYDSLVIKHTLVTDEVIEECMNNDKKVYVWTINSYNEYMRLKDKLQNHFDDIIIVSDNPDVMCYLNNCSDKKLTKIKK